MDTVTKRFFYESRKGRDGTYRAFLWGVTSKGRRIPEKTFGDDKYRDVSSCHLTFGVPKC